MRLLVRVVEVSEAPTAYLGMADSLGTRHSHYLPQPRNLLVAARVAVFLAWAWAFHRPPYPDQVLGGGVYYH